MKQIDKQIGNLLLDRLEEVLSQHTPIERIPLYRSILEDLFKALTADVSEQLSTLHNRTVYIFREYDIPGDIQRKTDSLRIFGNRVVHESDFIPRTIDDCRCVYQLAMIVSYFTKLPIREKISIFYSSTIDLIEKEENFIRPKRPTYDFFAVIENIIIPKGEASGKFCTLICNTDELGLIKLELRNNKNENDFGSDLSAFGKIAEWYQYIYVTDVVQQKDKEDEYCTTTKSLIVLEPDYLIDAKELSECRQTDFKALGKYVDNPLLYILSRFTKGEITDKLMIGNIVGQMLDGLVTNPDYNYKNSFACVMRDNTLGMLCLAHANGNYDRQNINKMFIRAKEHERQLRAVLQNYKSYQCIIEPTFISNKYGIQGRLDLLVDYGGKSNRKDIIELKSTENYPSLAIGLYNNHEAQALCYELLLDSTFPDRTGSSSILYSSAPIEEKPLRSVAKEKYISIQDLLMLRNRIVASEMKMAKGLFESFFEILADNSGPFPTFIKDQLLDFRNTIQNLDELLKQYFLGFIKFIYKEMQVAKIGGNNLNSKSNGYADLWKASKSDKIENYDVLINLNVKNISDDFHLTLAFENNLLSNINTVILSSFRVGDTAIFYPTPDPEVLNPLNSQILKCRVLAVNYETIEISLINKQVDKAYFKSNNFWALERDFRENGYKQQLQLMYQFLKSNSHVIDLVLGIERPQFNIGAEILQRNLDPIQHENVKNAMNAKDYYLIQGPPGTGKTSKVLVEIVRNLSVKDTDTMVVAFTNRAVDEICERLLVMGVECIRLGRGDKSYYWSHLSQNLKLDEFSERISKNKIFISTISTFASSLDILKFKKFDTLIVDEASQVLECQITGVLKYFRKWIFIGDENQLPAVVVQNKDDCLSDSEELQELSLLNFRESLFYRLKKNAVKKSWNDCHGMLKYQYRMHEDVAEFSKKYFYNDRLEIGNEKQNAPLLRIQSTGDSFINEVFSKSRVVFIPTKIDLRSKINNEEAVLTASLINQIALIYGEQFNQAKTVGVITPFRAQIANIRNKLNTKFRDVTIDTVERFQGSERDIIIISLATKSTTQFSAIQSMNEEGVDRKLNVALTRAKERVIILGSEEVLQKSDLFKKLIGFIKARGGYMTNLRKAKLMPTELF